MKNVITVSVIILLFSTLIGLSVPGPPENLFDELADANPKTALVVRGDTVFFMLPPRAGCTLTDPCTATVKVGLWHPIYPDYFEFEISTYQLRTYVPYTSGVLAVVTEGDVEMRLQNFPHK